MTAGGAMNIETIKRGFVPSSFEKRVTVVADAEARADADVSSLAVLRSV